MNKLELFENIKRKKSFLCVGLDTDIKKIPEHLLKEEVVDQVLPDIVPIPISAVPEYQSSLEATEVRSIRSNCAIRANQSFVKLNINGISIEIDDSVSVEFLSKLLKAVRYA